MECRSLFLFIMPSCLQFRQGASPSPSDYGATGYGLKSWQLRLTKNVKSDVVQLCLSNRIANTMGLVQRGGCGLDRTPPPLLQLSNDLDNVRCSVDIQS